MTIDNDFAHAIELLKSLPDDESRFKAHVYMEGIAQMRNEWLKHKGTEQRAKGTGAQGRRQGAKGQRKRGKEPE